MAGHVAVSPEMAQMSRLADMCAARPTRPRKLSGRSLLCQVAVLDLSLPLHRERDMHATWC
jgi:hypothetical protein